MATADAEAIIDSIEELVQEASHGDGTATVTRLADPVLSKTSQPSTQGELHSKPPGQRICLGCLPSTDYLLCSAAAAMMLFLALFLAICRFCALATLHVVLQATCKAASTDVCSASCRCANCFYAIAWQPVVPTGVQDGFGVMSVVCSDKTARKLIAAYWLLQGEKKRVGMWMWGCKKPLRF